MRQLSFQDYPREPVVIDNLSVKFMKQARFIPISLQGNTLKIAMADPGDVYLID
ncbi:MAG: type II secretion system protein GspE, partial [Desulfobacteraceae bacterium]